MASVEGYNRYRLGLPPRAEDLPPEPKRDGKTMRSITINGKVMWVEMKESDFDPTR